MTEQVKIENARYARTKMPTGRIKYEAGNRSAYIGRGETGPYVVERFDFVNGINGHRGTLHTLSAGNACDIAREWVTGEESGRTWKHTTREVR